MAQRAPIDSLGLVQALSAAMLWGVLPLYFKALQGVEPLEVVAYRVLWSIPLLLIILWLRKNLSGLKDAWADPKIHRPLFFSALMIAINWLFYVWAVHNDHVIAASLGYFISPLLSVFLGHIVLKEDMSRNQWIAIAIAALGVSVLAIEAWQTLWISVILAASWSCYALTRKIAPVGPMAGLSIETTYLFPLFAGYLLWIGWSGTSAPDSVHFGDNLTITALLVGASVMTATPLLLFAAAVKKMNLGTISLIQYIAPSIQFLIAIFIFQEPLSISQLVCFVLIWTSLALFSWDMLWGQSAKNIATETK